MHHNLLEWFGLDRVFTIAVRVLCAKHRDSDVFSLNYEVLYVNVHPPLLECTLSGAFHLGGGTGARVKRETCMITAGRNVQSLFPEYNFLSVQYSTPLRSTVPSGSQLYLVIRHCSAIRAPLRSRSCSVYSLGERIFFWTIFFLNKLRRENMSCLQEPCSRRLAPHEMILDPTIISLDKSCEGFV